MKQYKYILLLFLFLISSCSDSNGNDSGAIQVDIKNQASQQIQIVSSTSTKTGKVNPVEVQITLKNNSSSQQQLLLDGRWLDSNGGFNGGSQRIIKLEAGQSLSIVEGTRSSRVTRYQASLNVSNKTQGQVLNEALTSNKQVIATGYGMTYSTTPSTEKIPDLPIRGVANNLPFEAKTITFRTDDKGNWKLEISDREFDPVTGIAMERLDNPDVQTVYINLSETPVKGKTYNQTMQYGGGMFQVKPGADSQGTTSWNTSLAYKIEITDWQKGESTHFSCGRPKIGKAAGRLYISFKGSEDEGKIKNSWISGTFKDASILYCGDS